MVLLVLHIIQNNDLVDTVRNFTELITGQRVTISANIERVILDDGAAYYTTCLGTVQISATIIAIVTGTAPVLYINKISRRFHQSLTCTDITNTSSPVIVPCYTSQGTEYTSIIIPFVIDHKYIINGTIQTNITE